MLVVLIYMHYIKRASQSLAGQARILFDCIGWQSIGDEMQQFNYVSKQLV